MMARWDEDSLSANAEAIRQCAMFIKARVQTDGPNAEGRAKRGSQMVARGLAGRRDVGGGGWSHPCRKR